MQEMWTQANIRMPDEAVEGTPPHTMIQ